MELIIGASYPARRSGAIVVGESKQGALMVYVPFVLTGIAFNGNHSVCIGTKDGTLQERAIEGLRDIFGWTTENPFDLQRIEIPEGDAPEFILADYHNEPYTPNGKSEQVDSYKFRWLNKLSSGITPATADDESAALAKWGKKFGAAPSTPKAATKPVAKPEVKEPVKPKRTLATKPAKVQRTWTGVSLVEALAVKHGVDKEEQGAMDTLGNDVYFPVCDKLFGNGNMPETPEQLEQAAVELGL
jgi:hypothetical protein